MPLPQERRALSVVVVVVVWLGFLMKTSNRE